MAVAKAIEERRRRKVQLALAASVLALTTLGGLSTTYYLQQRAGAGRGRSARRRSGRPRSRVRPSRSPRRSRAGRSRWPPSSRPTPPAIRRPRPDSWPCNGRSRPGWTRPGATRRCSIAWSTSARPRPTTRTARSPTPPTPTPSARPGSTWRACRRPRRGRRSRPGRRRWRWPWPERSTTGRRSAGGSGRTPPARLRLSEAARVADPDPWRNELRTALDQPDKAARRTALQALAKDGEFRRAGADQPALAGDRSGRGRRQRSGRVGAADGPAAASA